MTSDRSVNEPGHSTQSSPRQRRGCSCTTCVLYLIFLFAIVAFGGWMTAQWFSRQFIVKGLTPAEVTEFEKWLDELITLPAEFTVRHEPDSPEMTKRKEELALTLKELSDSLSRYSSYRTTMTMENVAAGRAPEVSAVRVKLNSDLKDSGIYPSGDGKKFVSLFEKIVLRLPLTEDEETSLTTALAETDAAMARIAATVDHPDYVINTRGVIPSQGKRWHSPQTFYGASHFYRLLDNTTGSLQALRAALDYQRCDPEWNATHSFLSNGYLRELRDSAARTSDVELLRQHLTLLDDYNKGASIQGADCYHLDPTLLRLPGLWKEFVPDAKMPQTRRDYMDFELALDTVMKPVWKNMPKSDPRWNEITPDKFLETRSLIALDVTLNPATRPSGKYITFTGSTGGDRLLFTFGRPAVRLGMRTLVYSSEASGFQWDPNTERLMQMAKIRLLATEIAQRIRELRGLPPATDAKMLADDVAPALWLDPYTDAPLGLSADHPLSAQQGVLVFFSVGPDKVPGNDDDILLDRVRK